MIYKQGNHLWSTAHGLCIGVPQTCIQSQLIYINSRQPPAAAVCRYLFISCLRMPAFPHHPTSSSPWSFLTKRWEEGTPLEQGPCPFPQTHTQPNMGGISTLPLMNLHAWLAATLGLGRLCVCVCVFKSDQYTMCMYVLCFYKHMEAVYYRLNDLNSNCFFYQVFSTMMEYFWVLMNILKR